jgi:pimeloyl-ACP methyl ester carboxylesterase
MQPQVEKIHVPINGVPQGMFIQNADAGSPVLLYLHGGPGMPTWFLNRKYPTGLEEHFVTVWWEQRGAGLSYHRELPPQSMTVEQFVADTLEVTNYLRRRFDQDKIYLMGHSWGSFIGIQAAARAPELYHAYIGVAQMTNQLRSEFIAYNYMLALAKERNNTKLLRKLQAAPPTPAPPLPDAYMALRDEAMHSLGVGTTHDMRSVVSGVFVPVWLDNDYTLRERLNIWRGKWSPHTRRLWNEMLTVDIPTLAPQLALPVYLLHGIHDYTVSYDLAKDYLSHLHAPRKGFYTYTHSAHSPIFEEPQKTHRILCEDILPGVTTLADGE